MNHRAWLAVVCGVIAVLLPGEVFGEGWDLERVEAAARARYDAGPGEAWELLERGTRAELERVPGHAQSLSVTATGQLPLVPSRGWVDSEQSVMGSISWALGDGPALQRGAILAHRETLQAQARERRWAYVARAQDAYVEWWRAATLLADLTEDVARLRLELAPLLGASGDSSLARRDVLDLQIALDGLDLEVTALRAQEASARAELARLLGQTPADPAPMAELAGGSIWPRLLALIDLHPELDLIELERRELLARADAFEMFAPWQVSLGAGAILSTWGDARAQVSLGLNVPLANPNMQEAARLRSEASALSLRRANRRDELEREWRSMGERHAALTARRAQGLQMLEGALTERELLLERAHGRGEIGLVPLLRSRLESHELRHSVLEWTADLLRSELRARALLLSLERNP